MLKLPDTIRGLLFDMDGVLTDTASVHSRAWKQTFDAYLKQHGDDNEFTDRDYELYVDGKPREDGVRDFLASRGMHPPEGTRADTPDMDTVWGVGNQKNKLVVRLIQEDGVKVYDGSVRLVKEARREGHPVAVVSSSANTKMILESAGILDLFDERVDGVRLAEEHIKGKPAPDSYLRGAELLGVPAANAAVFEDALAGVAAGKAGGFGLTVGVDRHGQPQALKDHGADIVVSDLSELIA